MIIACQLLCGIYRILFISKVLSKDSWICFPSSLDPPRYIHIILLMTTDINLDVSARQDNHSYVFIISLIYCGSVIICNAYYWPGLVHNKEVDWAEYHIFSIQKVRSRNKEIYKGGSKVNQPTIV